MWVAKLFLPNKLSIKQNKTFEFSHENFEFVHEHAHSNIFGGDAPKLIQKECVSAFDIQYFRTQTKTQCNVVAN